MISAQRSAGQYATFHEWRTVAVQGHPPLPPIGLSCGVMRESSAAIYLHYTEFVLNHRYSDARWARDGWQFVRWRWEMYGQE